MQCLTSSGMAPACACDQSVRTQIFNPHHAAEPLLRCLEAFRPHFILGNFVTAHYCENFRTRFCAASRVQKPELYELMLKPDVYRVLS